MVDITYQHSNGSDTVLYVCLFTPSAKKWKQWIFTFECDNETLVCVQTIFHTK